MIRFLFVFLSLAICISSQSQDKKQNLIAKGQQIMKAGGGYSFTEGPAVAPDGRVFFTDQPNDRILKWSVDGVLKRERKPAWSAVECECRNE